MIFLPRMTQKEVNAELAAMDRGFAKLMARPNGARLLLYEIGALDSPDPPKKSARSAKRKPAAKSPR